MRQQPGKNESLLNSTQWQNTIIVSDLKGSQDVKPQFCCAVHGPPTERDAPRRHRPPGPETLPEEGVAHRRVSAFCERAVNRCEQDANADKRVLLPAIRLRTTCEAARSRSSHETKRSGWRDGHSTRNSAATARSVVSDEASRVVRPTEIKPTMHFANSPTQGVIVTTTGTESPASTIESLPAPKKRRRVLLTIAALVLAAALAVIIWALTSSSSSTVSPAPTAPVDPYVQFCDNSPSLCN